MPDLPERPNLDQLRHQFDQGALKAVVVLDAARRYGIDLDAPDPRRA